MVSIISSLLLRRRMRIFWWLSSVVGKRRRFLVNWTKRHSQCAQIAMLDCICCYCRCCWCCSCYICHCILWGGWWWWCNWTAVRWLSKRRRRWILSKEQHKTKRNLFKLQLYCYNKSEQCDCREESLDGCGRMEGGVRIGCTSIAINRS